MARSIYSYVHIWICPHFSDFHCIMTVLLHHARAGGCKISYVVLLRVHYKSNQDLQAYFPSSILNQIQD